MTRGLMHNGQYNRRSFDGSYVRVTNGAVESCPCKDCKASMRKSIHEHIAHEMPGGRTDVVRRKN